MGGARRRRGGSPGPAAEASRRSDRARTPTPTPTPLPTTTPTLRPGRAADARAVARASMRRRPRAALPRPPAASASPASLASPPLLPLSLLLLVLSAPRAASAPGATAVTAGSAASAATPATVTAVVASAAASATTTARGRGGSPGAATAAAAASSFGASWFYMGVLGPDAYIDAGAGACRNVPGLTRRQQRVCRDRPDHMTVVARAARSAILECQRQFRNARWNCSTVRDRSVFGPVMQFASREMAFTYATAAAAVVHAVARACHDGQLATCSCATGSRPRNLRADWIWGGCSDNLEYGVKFAQQFVDGREKRIERKSARGLMNLHNNRAGRRAVTQRARITCKCHGVSGSCTLRSCWKQLAPFKEIGDLLKDRYDGATEVRLTEQGRLETRDRRFLALTPNALVYLEESPSYCARNLSTGVLGTQGRQCNRTSQGLEGCTLLCCGRGYNTYKATVRERCECKFHWCCYVECKVCTRTVDVHTCK